MSHGEEDFLAEALEEALTPQPENELLDSRYDILRLPTRATSEESRGRLPLFFLNLRPMRKRNSLGSLLSARHMSSFVSPDAYTVLEKSLFTRRILTVGESTPTADPTELQSQIDDLQDANLLQQDAIENDPSTTREQKNTALELSAQTLQRSIEILRKQAREYLTDVKNLSGTHTHSLYFAPFYLVSHMKERATSLRKSSGKKPPAVETLRALPILSPNLPDPFLDYCAFLSTPIPTYPDSSATPLHLHDDTPDLTLGPRESARVFLALWVGPPSGSRVAGWNVAERVSATDFRLKVRTGTRRSSEETREERERLADSERRTTRRTYTNTKRAVVVTAQHPRIAERSSIGDFQAEYSEDLATISHKQMVELLLSPGPIQPELVEKPDDAEFRPRKLSYPTELPELHDPEDEDSSRSMEYKDIHEALSDIEPDGLFAIVELPETLAREFDDLSLQMRGPKLNGQQRRRLVRQKRRPTRPAATHCIVTKTGQARIALSPAHFSLLLTPAEAADYNPEATQLCIRALKLSKTQIALRVFATFRENRATTFNAGRHCAGTTLSEDLKKSYSVQKLIMDQEKPNYVFLDEDPLLTDPANPATPTKSGRRELTLIFRSYVFDHEAADEELSLRTSSPNQSPGGRSRPNLPLPDGNFVLDEGE